MEVQREVFRLCLGFRSNRWDKEFHHWYIYFCSLNIIIIELKLLKLYTTNSVLLFAPGKPVFGTLIALLYRGTPVRISYIF